MLFNEQHAKPIAQIVLWIPILYYRSDNLFKTWNTTGWWVIEQEYKHCIIVYPVWLFLFIHSFIHSLVIPTHEFASNRYWILSITPSYTRSLPYHSFSILPISLKSLQSHSNSTTIHFPLQPDSLLINNPIHLAIHSTNTHIKQVLYYSLLSTPWTLACCSSCHYSSLHAW